MPPLVHFLLRHALIGIGVGVLFVGALMMLDVARLGTLVAQSSSGLVALVALTCAVGITFGSVQMGFAIMLLGGADDTQGKGRRLRPLFARLKPAMASLPARAASAGQKTRPAPRR